MSVGTEKSKLGKKGGGMKGRELKKENRLDFEEKVVNEAHLQRCGGCICMALYEERVFGLFLQQPVHRFQFIFIRRNIGAVCACLRLQLGVGDGEIIPQRVYNQHNRSLVS